MEKIRSKDGTIISFTKSGTGAPLLLVHGTTANHKRWAPILPGLQKHFTVYAMDRRGRGESGDSSDYHFMRETEDVAAVVDNIGKPVSILGHSFGAICSLEGALLTENVNRLILYEPPLPIGLPLYFEGAPDKMQKLIDEGKLETALEFFLKMIVGMPEREFKVYRELPLYKERIKLAPTIPRELTIDRYYIFNRDKYADLEIPVLLLLGSHSPSFIRDATEELESALPNCRVVELQGEQHIAMDTNPEQFLNEVVNFLLK